MDYRSLHVLVLNVDGSDAKLNIREVERADIAPVTAKVVSKRSDFEKAFVEFRPHLIISEYENAEFTGKDALLFVRKCDPDLPFIIVSNMIGEDQAIDLIRSGASDYVSKTHRLERLCNSVKTAISKHQEVVSTNESLKRMFDLNMRKLEDETFELVSLGKPLNILLVDENADVDSLKYHLEMSDVQAFFKVVENANDYLTSLRTNKPDVILTSVAITRFSALELRNEICPEVPFVFIAKVSHDEFAVQAIKAGATDYLAENQFSRLATVLERGLLYAKAKQRREIQTFITQVLAESANFSAAAPLVLETMCGITNSDVGVAWHVSQDGTSLEFTELWHDEAHSYDNIEAATRGVTFRPGAGLPGIAWSSRKISTDLRSRRAQIAKTDGLRNAFAVPILFQNRVLGVLEFFNRQAIKLDDETEKFILNLGLQIGLYQERKRNESSYLQAMEQTVQLSQHIIENAPVAIAKLDEQCIIFEANTAFCRLISRSERETIGSSFWGLVPQFPREGLLDVINNGTPLSQESVYVPIKAGDSHTEAHWDITAWRVASDRSDKGAVMVIQDATERVNLAIHREMFSQTLTHDMKAPLIGAERILTDFIAGRIGEVSEQQVRYLSLLKESTRSVYRMVRNLIELSAYRSGSRIMCKETLLLNEIAGECIKDLASFSDSEHVTVKLDCSGPIFVIADLMATKILITNLLENAIKFSPEQSQVIVSLKSAARETQLSISDCGPGLSELDKNRIFSAQWQGELGKAVPGGTGLGLYLCHKISQSNESPISFESVSGKGTTFTVRFSRQNRSE